MSELKESIFGLIPKKWNIIDADEYCHKVTDGTHDSPKQSLSGFPLVTSRHIKGSEIDFSNTYLISKEDFDNINKRSYVSQWDVIISMIGEYCGFTYLEENSTINYAIKNVGLFKTKNEIDSKWLYYFFQSKSTNFLLNTYRSGTSQPYLSLGVLRKFPIIIPENNEEKKQVVLILDSLRYKIELLQTQNKTLETLAQTIFKEWFGKYHSGDELPEDWKVAKLGNEFDITIGRTPPRIEQEWFSNTPIGKKWISIKDIGNSGTYIYNTSEYLTDEAINRFNIPIIPENTTILSFKMTVGKLTITTEDMLSNEAIAHLKVKADTALSTEFIYLYLQNLDFNALGSTSSIVTAINSTMIKAIEIVIPKKDILVKFDNVIKPLFNKMKINAVQIQTLTKTRDELLPKLISGEIRVEI